MPLPVGGSFPAFASFDSSGRLVYCILHSKGPIVTVFDSVVSDGTRATLALRSTCFDVSGLEILTMCRVFTKAI